MTAALLTYHQDELPFPPAPPCRYEAVLTCNDVTTERIPLDTLVEAESAIVALMQAAQAEGVQVANHTELDFVGLRHGEVWRARIDSIPLEG